MPCMWQWYYQRTAIPWLCVGAKTLSLLMQTTLSLLNNLPQRQFPQRRGGSRLSRPTPHWRSHLQTSQSVTSPVGTELETQTQQCSR